MVTRSKKKRTADSGWTVDSGVLLFRGEPQIELHTVTRAHCTFLSRHSSYGIVLVSPDKKASVRFGLDVKAFSQTGSKILLALQRSAPQVRVHMRGGPLAAAIHFLLGLVLLGFALWFVVAKLISEVKYGWEALPFVLFFGALGAGLIWLYHPWNGERLYATPKRAATSIKHGGWRAFYRRYG